MGDQLIERRMEKANKMLRVGDKEAKITIDFCQRAKARLLDLAPLRGMNLLPEDMPIIREIAPLTIKPMFYIANIGEEDLQGESHALPALLQEHAHRQGLPVVPFCARLEQEIHELDKEEQQEFIEQMGLEKSATTEIINTGYRVLNLVTFYTKVGPELRAWTIPQGTKAPRAAGIIHTDFEKGFIKAEVVSFQSFVQAGSEAEARNKGLIRVEGKDYTIQDGDIIHFRFKG